MLKSRKYKENKEKTDNLFGSIKEKCYFANELRLSSVDTPSELLLPRIMAQQSRVFLKTNGSKQ